MKKSNRLVAVLLLALAGCFGGGGKSQPVDTTFTKALQGLKVVQPTEHVSDGKMHFGIGGLEADLPLGWTPLRIAGQTKYISPTGQETIQIFGYTSETRLDDQRMHDILLSLNELGSQGEHLMSRFAKIELSTPSGGRTDWGADMRFSALGPMNRMSFHYSTVAANEAMMIQFDGNSMENTPAHAVELIKSFHYKGAIPAPAAPAPKVAPAK